MISCQCPRCRFGYYPKSYTFGGNVPPEDKKMRTLKCPYCGYTVTTEAVGNVYCGPHVSSAGNNTYPKVLMQDVGKFRTALAEKDGK